MSKYIDKGTVRQHLTDRLMESAFNNFRVRAYVDDVYVDIIDNRLPVWIDELPTYDVQEVRHGRWIDVEPAPHNLFYATCSVCGDRQTIEVANYCPMCGASMGRKSKCVECKGGYCEDECGAKMDEVGE